LQLFFSFFLIIDHDVKIIKVHFQNIFGELVSQYKTKDNYKKSNHS
jgi:hypothetical protein